ncbi:DUF86 domain-containing protein [Paenibacillus mucilaginosus]|uniref:DUF86 domain-containing protein n=3 Tax=Paenibacillus mucilaginosus TaxID=61624 RepID=H6NH56_9BACL|nr:HepT-like ribonuclease domain-containing protein [Paenibacillus mucilaginosus]AEI40082.1 conserved hypothetical protein [Paenibacillus mucilaginosus KNP414]AFC28734.1 hypothetical protein PM3016_1826 [Paenibacillus mucilaginosus 3016]AFH60912.1 hypothetical protein B2K_09290 [Paenibacillus mucilaginosus K02]MCG7215688.1 DUF86 domain-containing protein [Paenibacillus mucilaginosus]WDM29320.1 DUF86 domain-containing protein [Paenibacillus mucilaginosus]
MYYVNHEQIDTRLAFLPTLTAACRQLEAAAWAGGGENGGALLLHLAQERTLYLAIETVTDVGSLLIDAFMMRDASSYEDIVDILAGEGVLEADTAAVLRELVGLRRALTQEYTSVERSGLHPMISRLPAALEAFAERVPAFIRKEVI